MTEIAVAVRHEGKYLLRKRTPGERWAGLWDFIRFPLENSTNLPAAPNVSPPRSRGARPSGVRSPSLPAIAEAVRHETGLAVAIVGTLGVMRHSVTRFRITLECYMAECAPGQQLAAGGTLRWVAPRSFGRYPLSVTGRTLAKRLESLPESVSLDGNTNGQTPAARLAAR